MSELGLVDSDVEDIDGSGLCAIPGLVDCHTHPAFGGDRVEEFSLRAGGASYEELHAAGGGILSTVRATRDAGERGCARPSSVIAAGCSAPEPPRSRGSPATGSTARRSSHRCGRSKTPAASRRSSARMRLRRSSRTRTRISTSCWRTCSPRRPSSPRRPTCSWSAAPSTRLRHAATSKPPVTTASPSASTATSSRSRARSRWRSSSALGPSITSRQPARGHRRTRGQRGHRRAAAGERSLPRPPDAAGTRARRRRRCGRARDRLQPRQRLLREPADRDVARRDAAEAESCGGTVGVHRQRGARARPRRPHRQDRPGLRRRSRPARRARLASMPRTTSAATSSRR